HVADRVRLRHSSLVLPLDVAGYEGNQLTLLQVAVLQDDDVRIVVGRQLGEFIGGRLAAAREIDDRHLLDLIALSAVRSVETEVTTDEILVLVSVEPHIASLARAVGKDERRRNRLGHDIHTGARRERGYEN